MDAINATYEAGAFEAIADNKFAAYYDLEHWVMDEGRYLQFLNEIQSEYHGCGERR